MPVLRHDHEWLPLSPPADFMTRSGKVEIYGVCEDENCTALQVVYDNQDIVLDYGSLPYGKRAEGLVLIQLIQHFVTLLENMSLDLESQEVRLH